MRKQNGITLIALIITIIIMLILVGVSVNVVINSDMIRTADKAVKAWNEETQKENETINELDQLIDDLVNNRMDPTPLYAALYSDGALVFYADSTHILETRNGASLVQKTVDISNTADLSFAEAVSLLPWSDDNEFAKKVTSVIIADKVAPKSGKYLFRNLININKIEGFRNLNTCNMTSMRGMFTLCNNLATINLSHFNTENVTDMAMMFVDCYNLKQLDLRNFNTSKVIDMDSIFYGCANLETVDISNWDTGSMQNMTWAFGSGDNATIPNVMNLKRIIGIENLDVSNVTTMERMFRNCKKLETLDLHKWDVSNVENMLQLFNGCRSLKTLNIDGWNMKNVTNIQYMFNSCEVLEGTIALTFDSTKITTYTGTFNGTAQNSNNPLIVNYTSSATGIIDNVIATQSGDKVQKGSQID